MKNIELLKSKDIYLFPFTAEAAFLVHVLENNGFKIKAIYDNNDNLYSEKYCGIPFVKPVDNENQAVIVAGHRHYDKAPQYFTSQIIKINQIIDNDDVEKCAGMIDLKAVEEINIRQITKAKNIKIELKQEALDAKPNDKILSQFGISLTSYCNLKCKSCCSLIQYYKNKIHRPLKSLIDDIDCICSKVDYIRRMTIVGGEPLLYPYLYEFLQHISKYKNRILGPHITTNGTIIPDNKILNIMAENQIEMWISVYGEISKKANDLFDLCQKNGVIVRKNENMTWIPMMQPQPYDKNAQERFNRCWCRILCPICINGKLYPCSFATNASDLKMIPYSEENFIDIYKAGTDEIVNFQTNRKKCHDSCYYCSGADSSFPDIPVAEQIKSPLDIPFNFPETYPENWNV